MKKYFFFALIALFVSCQKEKDAVLDNKDVVESSTPQTYTCSIADLNTKVSVDVAGKTTWEDGDKIVIHGYKVNENVEVELHEFSNNNKDASFSVDLSGVRGVDNHPGEYYVSYPASAYIGLSGNETGYNGYYSGFSDTNHPLLAGYLDGNEFKFFNLCGVLTFVVDGDYNGYLFEGNRAETVGYDEYRVKITSETQDYKSWKTAGDKSSITGLVNGDGSSLNYIYFPNGASFPNGFTLYLMKDGVIKGYVTSDKSISIDRGHQKNIGLLPAGKIHARPMAAWATNAIDLNNLDGKKQDPANCYLLVRNSTYRDKVFKIWAVKGNDLSQPIEGIASVEVLWESRCEEEASSAPGYLVSDVDFDKNHIYFKTPSGDDFKDGNAVIAAKDSEGNILWSWHIWVSNTIVTSISSPAISKTAVMDRNLGAIKVATITAKTPNVSYGLHYQWGRKDPFLGAKRTNSSSVPGYNSGASRTFSVNSGKITLDYSIRNPMVYGYSAYNENWCTTETFDNEFWSDSQKTIYDPCPSGYRVMKMDTGTELWSWDNASNLSVVTGWASYNDYFTFTFGDASKDPSEQVVFPLAGYKDGNLTTESPSSRAGVWSSRYRDEGRAYFINIRPKETTPIYKMENTGKARAYSVRCVAE